MKRKISTIVILLITIAGCSDLFVPPPDSSTNVEDFETAWNAVNNVYPMFEYKNINWDEVYLKYRPKVDNTSEDFSKILFDMLRELKDPHVVLSNKGLGLIIPYPGERLQKDFDAFSPIVVRKYFDKELKFSCNDKVEYGILPENIGYIRIATFNGEGTLDGFNNVLDEMLFTKGLIIDVRKNNGGKVENINKVVGRFIENPMQNLRGYKTGGIPINIDPIQPVRDKTVYKNPVAILINGTSISGAEVFAENMKQLEFVTVIGDTTDGAGCSDYIDEIEGDYFLPSGRYIKVGNTYWLRYDGIPVEWNGVPPDILIMQTKADMDAGKDKQLEYAIQLLSK